MCDGRVMVCDNRVIGCLALAPAALHCQPIFNNNNNNNNNNVNNNTILYQKCITILSTIEL